MTALDSGPCQVWTPHPCTVFPDDTVAVSGVALEAATELLWERSHRRFGLCSVTLRPCKQECWPAGAMAWLGSWLPTTNASAGGWGWPYPALLGGRWYNLGCDSCGDSCSCTMLQQVKLPNPVASVTQVKVDGVVLAPSAYRVDNWQWLVRIDGNMWPTCNDLNLDDTHVGTWSVTASYGEIVPESARFAVGELAVMIAKACVQSGCAPSATTTTIQRQGVTKNLLADLDGKRIGLRMCDLFLRTYNPGNNRPAVIFDIDGQRARRVGT